MEEAINLVSWHTTCKNGLRGKNLIRQIELETLPDEEQNSTDTTDVRRIGGKRFVTEERLNQFGRELKESITSEVTNAMKSMSNTLEDKLHGLDNQKQKFRTGYDKNTSSWQKVEEPRIHKPRQNNAVKCYNCQGEGHFAKDCKKPQQLRRPTPENEKSLNN